MDRLTKKLKKGGYSANRNSEEKLQERLDQFLGVHQYWLEQVQEMEQGIGQASEMGPEGDLSLMMLKTAYNAKQAIVEGKSFHDTNSAVFFKMKSEEKMFNFFFSPFGFRFVRWLLRHPGLCKWAFDAKMKRETFCVKQ